MDFTNLPSELVLMMLFAPLGALAWICWHGAWLPDTLRRPNDQHAYPVIYGTISACGSALMILSAPAYFLAPSLVQGLIVGGATLTGLALVFAMVTTGIRLNKTGRI
jgi:hypothetical protein